MLFVKKLDYGIRGLGYATTLTYFSMLVFVTIYSLCIPRIKDALIWPNLDAFRGWGEYFSVGIPSCIMRVAEGSAFQIMMLLSGIISVNDQAVYIIMLGISSLMFTAPTGIQCAASAIIGSSIGGNKVSQARAQFKVMSVVAIVTMIVV